MILPGWLTNALEVRSALADPLPWSGFTGYAAPEPGSIYVIERMDRDRDAALGLVLASSAGASHRAVRIVLVSADTEMATDNDLVINKESCDLPYDVIVRTDLAAPVLMVQMGPAIGSISPRDLDIVEASVAGGPGRIPRGRRGLRIIQRQSERLLAKTADIATTQELASTCMRELLMAEKVVISCDVAGESPEVVAEALRRGGSVLGARLAEAPPDLAAMGLGDCFESAMWSMAVPEATAEVADLGLPPAPTVIRPADMALPARERAQLLTLARASVCFLVGSTEGSPRGQRMFCRIDLDLPETSTRRSPSLQAVLESV